MATITRNLKPAADYQQWAPGDMSVNDVLGVFESLGGREAHSVTIESLDGPSTVRFNVVQKVYKDYPQGFGQSSVGAVPNLVTEVKIAKSDVVIEQDSTQTWLAREIAVSDIEIIVKATGLKITVT